ncbi:MAG: molybdopterin-synthase adenylyltransferase MoeB [Acidobacteriota bacterium]|jgi:molybdopterin/thiamine biosynthesis adenylyltransferase/rhodanese-related sulfurtransferase
MNSKNQSAEKSVDSVGLSHDEIKRYSRHLIMPEVGMSGQRKLKAASVLIVGAGGLGSPLALYLAAAGVGHLGLVDYDVVDSTNLQRQIIHGTGDIGRLKTESAGDRLVDMNPYIRIDTYKELLCSENALEILGGYDLVVDGTDNFPTRYLLNDACVLLKKPYIFGGIFRFDGQVSVFCTEDGPCYRCLFSHPPSPGSVPSCAEGGVLGILPGTIGTIQATEAIKIILGLESSLAGRLLIYNALEMDFRFVKIRKDPDCPVCGNHPTIRALIDYEEFCRMPAHDHSEWAKRHDDLGVPSITPNQLKQRLENGDRICLLDVREPHELEISQIREIKSIHIPQHEVLERMNELDTSQEIVVFCRFGLQSIQAVRQLQDHGFKKLYNLEGGINRWAADVDPSLPLY